MKISKEEFTQKIEANWKKIPSDSTNPRFLDYCQTFFEEHAGQGAITIKNPVIAKNFYYKNQINLKELYEKLYLEEDFPLDGEEIILFVQGGMSLLTQAIYVITNQNLYYKSQSSKKLTDVSESVGRIPLSDINETVEIKGWANYELLINGDLVGTIEIAGSGSKSYAKLIEKFFNGLVSRNTELITQENESPKEVDSFDKNAAERRSRREEEQKEKAEQLKEGESIDKGYCPDCGDVAVKTSNAGYNAGCLAIIIHIILSIVTVGGWLTIWGSWILFKYIFNKGDKVCMTCGKQLRKRWP